MPNAQEGRRNQGGTMRDLREQTREIGQNFQEGAERVSRRMREGYDTARERAGQSYRRAEGIVARHPAPSLMFSFGLGFGLGVLIAVALT
jgi:ElaB/YqjD/DUF883 family membrane-anchored ribosome-binding protein